MVANDAGRDVPRAAVTPSLVVAALMAVYLGVMMGSYLDGPSVEAALDSYAVQNDKSQHGLTYTFLYQDVDKLGQTRYYFRHTDGCTKCMILTCKFRWFDHVEGLDFRPAGWDYVYTCYVPEDITTVPTVNQCGAARASLSCERMHQP